MYSKVISNLIDKPPKRGFIFLPSQKDDSRARSSYYDQLEAGETNK